MSLFALNNEFQRSIYSVWEEFSGHSRAHAKVMPEKAKDEDLNSVLMFGNPQQGSTQTEIPRAISFREAHGSAFLQHDIKAWGRFLDSKRTG